ncbi:MAG: hypothetical protein KDJ66_06570 [Nitratireductor sp.]|nr:hypothetical protein [Nitratireductor sp.]MCB1457053.1 hypothetical protein [Nitratireductor sp.]
MQRFFWPVVLLAAGTYGLLISWGAMTLHQAAGGLPSFDIRFSAYTADQARAYIEALGETGRAFYLGPVRILDTIFPLSFTLALVLGYFRWIGRERSGIRAALVLVALVYLVCDMWENSGVAAMLLDPQAIDPAMVKQIHLVTLAKWFYALFALAAWLWLGLANWRKRG